MKIGILTFPNSRSYGAALQMAALYRVCRDLGYDTEIINYYDLWMKQEKHLEIRPGQNRAVVLAKRKLNGLVHWRMDRGFRRFEAKMVKYPVKAFTDPQQLRQLADRYGAVICGSDQVWNPNITGFDLSFFLDFCGSETARISYAPSFGVEALPEAFGEKVRRELEKFQHISVREDSGKKLVSDLTGRDARIVADPTLLLDAFQWRALEQKHPRAEGAYILYYTVRSSHSLWKHCLALAEKTGMRILRIGGNAITGRLKASAGMEYVYDISPEQWLYLLRNARYVVTNSFHGTAFSVNFRKDFYVEFSSRTNTRLLNIITALGLQDRVLREDAPICPSSADYTKTEELLPALKEASLDFLKKALGAAAERYEG